MRQRAGIGERGRSPAGKAVRPCVGLGPALVFDRLPLVGVQAGDLIALVSDGAYPKGFKAIYEVEALLREADGVPELPAEELAARSASRRSDDDLTALASGWLAGRALPRTAGRAQAHAPRASPRAPAPPSTSTSPPGAPSTLRASAVAPSVSLVKIAPVRSLSTDIADPTSSAGCPSTVGSATWLAAEKSAAAGPWERACRCKSSTLEVGQGAPQLLASTGGR